MGFFVFLLTFAWSIANLFLAYFCATSIGGMWGLETVANLKFLEYWGYVFVFSCFAAPSVGMLITQAKQDSEYKEFYGPIAQFVTTFILCFCWVVSLVCSFLFL